MPTLSQAELRRRLRAARILADLTFDELAQKIDPTSRLSSRTIRKLEGGDELIREPHLRTLAPVLGVPYRWFTVVSLPAAVGGEEFEERISRLESALRDWIPPDLLPEARAEASQRTPIGEAVPPDAA